MSTIDDIEGNTLEADACYVNGKLQITVYIPGSLTDEEHDNISEALYDASIDLSVS